MTSKVEKSIEVEAPLQRVYNQWTQFEQFPEFMGGVEEVKQLNDTTLHSYVPQLMGRPGTCLDGVRRSAARA